MLVFWYKIDLLSTAAPLQHCHKLFLVFHALPHRDVSSIKSDHSFALLTVFFGNDNQINMMQTTSFNIFMLW